MINSLKRKVYWLELTILYSCKKGYEDYKAYKDRISLVTSPFPNVSKRQPIQSWSRKVKTPKFFLAKMIVSPFIVKEINYPENYPEKSIDQYPSFWSLVKYFWESWWKEGTTSISISWLLRSLMLEKIVENRKSVSIQNLSTTLNTCTLT